MLCLVESSVQDMTTGDHIGSYSALRHSPEPPFGCRSVGSLAANLTTQFMDLEGPRYHYRPLFSIATERMVCTLPVYDISGTIQLGPDTKSRIWLGSSSFLPASVSNRISEVFPMKIPVNLAVRYPPFWLVFYALFVGFVTGRNCFTIFVG